MSEEKIGMYSTEEIYEELATGFLHHSMVDAMYFKIKDLQQKVEQLEKENIKQKEIIENLTTMTVCGDKKQIKNTAQYKLEQLENIRKEAIELINKNSQYPTYYLTGNIVKDLLNILNKGSENDVKKDNTNSN